MHSNSNHVVLCHTACRLCCWAACLSQAGAADLRQPGRAVRQTHEHHLHLGPQRSHHLLHHCEQNHTSTHTHQPPPLTLATFVTVTAFTWKPCDITECLLVLIFSQMSSIQCLKSYLMLLFLLEKSNIFILVSVVKLVFYSCIQRVLKVDVSLRQHIRGVIHIHTVSFRKRGTKPQL